MKTAAFFHVLTRAVKIRMDCQMDQVTITRVNLARTVHAVSGADIDQADKANAFSNAATSDTTVA